MIHLDEALAPGSIVEVEIVDALGPDLVAAGVSVDRAGDDLMVEPDKLATWANAITVGRLLLSPLMFWVIPNDEFGSWIAFTMWIVFSSTDFLDGYLARRQGTTSAGAFLDPLADKVLILGAMFTLVSTGVLGGAGGDHHREVVISVYRVLVGGKGISVPAIKLAKYKTVCQQLAVAYTLMPLTAVDATWLWNSFLWLASGTRW